MSFYGYVGDNPVNVIDPTGLEFNIGGEPWSSAISQFDHEFDDGVDAFHDNYDAMKAGNVVGSDQYYHCMANCQATQAGPGGAFAADLYSWGRECTDFPKNTIFRGISVADAWTDAQADMSVYHYGQSIPSGNSCDAACRPLLPASSKPFVPNPEQ